MDFNYSKMWTWGQGRVPLLTLGHPRARPAAAGELLQSLPPRSASCCVCSEAHFAGRGQVLPAMEIGGEKQSRCWHWLLKNHRIRPGIELESVFRLFCYCRAPKSFWKDYLLFKYKISRERFVKDACWCLIQSKPRLLHSYPRVPVLGCNVVDSLLSYPAHRVLSSIRWW